MKSTDITFLKVTYITMSIRLINIVDSGKVIPEWGYETGPIIPNKVKLMNINP